MAQYLQQDDQTSGALGRFRVNPQPEGTHPPFPLPLLPPYVLAVKFKGQGASCGSYCVSLVLAWQHFCPLK